MPNSIDIGIVNYNGGECLLKCIESIIKMTDVAINVFVFDNASSDGSIDNAMKVFSNCIYIRSEKNLGYAGGCNYLLREFKSEIVAVCNMDLEFSSDWAKNIIKCYEENSDAYSLASLVIQKDTNEIYATDIHFFWDLHPLTVNTLISDEKTKQVFGAYGAVMTFRKSVFEKIGFFDSDYFLFFEETEFFLRMSINKMKVFLCPVAKVYHHRSTATVRYSPLKLYYSERNRIWTAMKYLPFWYFPLIFPISVFRLFLMSKSGIPQNDGRGNKLNPAYIIYIILKAWLFSFGKTIRELKKRDRLWRKSICRPQNVFEIIKNYNLHISQLRIK